MSSPIADRIPHRDPFLFLDAVESLSPSKETVAVWNPQGRTDLGAGSVAWLLVVEAMAQAAAFLVAESLNVSLGAEGGFVFAKIYSAQSCSAVPYAPLRLKVQVRQASGRVWRFLGTAEAEGKTVCRAEFSGMLTPWTALKAGAFAPPASLLMPTVQGESFWYADPKAPFFKGHFPQKPVVPGVLLVEAMLRLRSGEPTQVKDVTFRAPLLPGQTVVFQSQDQPEGWKATAWVEGTLAAEATVVL